MQVLSWLYVGGAVLLLFGASVFVHEFGHFWMARRRGLRVDGFSIGFGPKIFGWTRDNIDYAWRWIPAGGFVKLPQMVTSRALEGATAQNLPPISPWSKILVALAGPFMNLVFAFMVATVIYLVGIPVRVNPAIVGHVDPTSAEALAGVRSGDRVVAVNSKRIKSWEDAQMIVAMARTNLLPVTLERSGVETTVWLQAKVNAALGLKLLDLDPVEHPVIEMVKPGSPAEAAGLKPGDQIISFQGATVVGHDQFVQMIRKRAEQASALQISRDGQVLALSVTPTKDPKTGNGVIGIQFSSGLTSVYQVQRPGPLPWEQVWDVVEQTVQTIGALMHSKQTGIGVKDLSGPPGILAMLAIELKTDIRLALRFMVLLNVSLAILNLLPLPVLDGGHILLAVIEKLRGRPLSPRLQEYASGAFGLVLISFMLYVSYNDVVRRFPLFRLMFHQQVQMEPGTVTPPDSRNPSQ